MRLTAASFQKMKTDLRLPLLQAIITVNYEKVNLSQRELMLRFAPVPKSAFRLPPGETFVAVARYVYYNTFSYKDAFVVIVVFEADFACRLPVASRSLWRCSGVASAYQRRNDLFRRWYALTKPLRR